MYPPFTPIRTTATIAVTVAATSVALPSTGQRTLVVTSVAGGAVAFIRFGSAATGQDATTADMPILPGSVQVFSIGDLDTFVSAITGAATATLYFTSGQGQ